MPRLVWGFSSLSHSAKRLAHSVNQQIDPCPMMRPSRTNLCQRWRQRLGTGHAFRHQTTCQASGFTCQVGHHWSALDLLRVRYYALVQLLWMLFQTHVETCRHRHR